MATAEFPMTGGPEDGRGAPAPRNEGEHETLDDWLDAALADTFPASDPIATPPEAPRV